MSKKLLLLFSYVLLLNTNTFSQIPPYIPVNGLILYYPFSGNTTDFSSNAIQAINNSAQLTTDRFGRCNEAYYFNGVNAYMSTVSPLLDNLSQFTVSFWIRVDDYPLIGSYVFAKGKEEPAYGDRLSWRCYIGGNPYKYIGTDNWLPSRYATTSTFSGTNWAHFVMVTNSSEQKLYINGVAAGAISQSGTVRVNADSLYIGTRHLFGSLSQFFKGCLDDLVIWNRAFTATEISSLYNNSIVAPFDDLIYSQDTTVLCGTSYLFRAKQGFNVYEWSPVLGLSSSVIYNPLYTANNNVSYVLKATGTGGCVVFDTIKIEVIKPTITLNRTSTICPGDSVQLVASGAQTYAWEWNTTLSDSSIRNPFAKPAVTTWYKLKAQVNGCAITDSALVTITNQLTVDAGVDSMVCIGDTIRLNAIGGSSFSWTPLQDILLPNAATPLVFPKTPTWYRVVSNSGSCTATDSVFVDVRPLPQLQINDTLFCGASSFAPTIAMQSGISSVRWEPSSFLSSNTVLTPIISATSSIAYKINAQTFFGCSVSDSFYVNISNVNADFSFTDNPIEVPGNLSVINTSSGSGLSYAWFLNNQPWSTTTNPTQPISVAGIYTVKLIAENTDGCIDSLEKEIEAKNEQKIFIPNVFTPNEDNVNDKFIFSIDMSLVERLDGTIWNRWGQKIADFNGLKDNWWDGKVEGSPCQDGVYFFMVTITDKKGIVTTYNGTVTLLR